jgi:hypothetical protein
LLVLFKKVEQFLSYFGKMVAMIAIGEPTETMDEKDFLKETLKLALEVMETPEVGPRASGFAAFQECAKAIGNDREFAENT